MFTTGRHQLLALWTTLGNIAHQWVNFGFGPNPETAQEIARLEEGLAQASQENTRLVQANQGLAVELAQASQEIERLALENQQLAQASQELASGLAETTEIVRITEAELAEAEEAFREFREEALAFLAGYFKRKSYNVRRRATSAFIAYLRGALQITRPEELAFQKVNFEAGINSLKAFAQWFARLRANMAKPSPSLSPSPSPA